MALSLACNAKLEKITSSGVRSDYAPGFCWCNFWANAMWTGWEFSNARNTFPDAQNKMRTLL